MKAALVLNDDFSMWHFRKGLIKALIDNNVDVYVLTPGNEYSSKFESLGARHIEIPMSRFINPVEDLKTIRQLLYVFRKERFDIVHTMTIKPNIYGGLVAKMSGIRKIVGLVSGKGIMFVEAQDTLFKLLKPTVALMYRVFFRIADRVWFQNEDDLSFFVDKGYVSREKTVCVRSGGIDTKEYSMDAVSKKSIENHRRALGLSTSSVLISMITARMIWSKGVKEFIEVAQTLAPEYSNVKFLLVGPIENNAPDAVPVEYLKKQESLQLRMYLEFRKDVKEIIAASDVIVLPSYYPEGIPRVLLEALALSKPIITTNSVGCKEVVRENYNGYLVPPRDTQKLAEALVKLIQNPELRIQFGRKSRLRAEKEFEEKIVVGRVLRELYGLGQG